MAPLCLAAALAANPGFHPATGASHSSNPPGPRQPGTAATSSKRPSTGKPTISRQARRESRCAPSVADAARRALKRDASAYGPRTIHGFLARALCDTKGRRKRQTPQAALWRSARRISSRIARHFARLSGRSARPQLSEKLYVTPIARQRRVSMSTQFGWLDGRIRQMVPAVTSGARARGIAAEARHWDEATVQHCETKRPTGGKG